MALQRGTWGSAQWVSSGIWVLGASRATEAQRAPATRARDEEVIQLLVEQPRDSHADRHPEAAPCERGPPPSREERTARRGACRRVALKEGEERRKRHRRRTVVASVATNEHPSAGLELATRELERGGQHGALPPVFARLCSLPILKGHVAALHRAPTTRVGDVTSSCEGAATPVAMLDVTTIGLIGLHNRGLSIRAVRSTDLCFQLHAQRDAQGAKIAPTAHVKQRVRQSPQRR